MLRARVKRARARTFRSKPEHRGYWIASSLPSAKGEKQGPILLGAFRNEALGPAQRNAEVDGLERGRVAAPAVIGFLERERFLNPQFARNRKALSDCPRRLCLVRFLTPAHARAA